MDIFKGNHPVSANIDWHIRNEKGAAIDFALPVGTELYAVVNGVVEKHNTWWGGTDTIILVGDNGVCYLYAHCLRTIKTGRVSQGQVIGLSGNDGNSSGPHLHFAADKSKKQLLDWSVSWSNTELLKILNAPTPGGLVPKVGHTYTLKQDTPTKNKLMKKDWKFKVLSISGVWINIQWLNGEKHQLHKNYFNNGRIK